jgi:hypothetical protein
MPVTVTSSITLASIGVIASPQAGQVPAVFGLYSDTGGAPGALLTMTQETAIGPGTNVIPVIAHVSLGPGTYWIMGEYNSNAQICTDGASTSTTAYVPQTFDVLPDTIAAPHVNHADAAINCYIVGAE